MRHTRKATSLALVLVVFGIAACRSTQVTSGGVELGPTATPAEPGLLPTGTTLKVSLNQTVGADSSGVGDRFTATVQEPILASDGSVVLPEGAVVNGQVTGIKKSERIGDQAAIALDFDTIQVGPEKSKLDAEVVDTKVRGAGASGRRGATGAGAGAAAGAILGAIIEGWGGALVGGLIGAGTGTLIGLGTGEASPKLPEGTELSLRTTAPTKIAKIPRTGPY